MLDIANGRDGPTVPSCRASIGERVLFGMVANIAKRRLKFASLAADPLDGMSGGAN